MGDEPPIVGEAQPTAVYLVGRAGPDWRIALVVRKPGARDDDD